MNKLSEYHLPIELRSYDVDAWGEVPDGMLLSILEHVARAASAAAGFDGGWYEAHGLAWVIRRITLARPLPLRLGDELRGRTWISEIRRVRSNRDYEIRLAGGRVAVAARTEWVFIDRGRQRPVAIDPAILERVDLYPAVGGLDPLPVTAADGTPPVFTSRRKAGRTECDSMGHVNNAVYATWLDEALADALAESGVQLAIPGQPGPRPVTTHLVVDYLQSALPGDEIEIRTRLLGATSDPAVFAWEQEVLRAGSGERLAQCVSQRRVLRG